MQGELNQSPGKKNATRKKYQQSISQGQFYTLLFKTKKGEKILLFNF